jgi:hypothetical protein
MKKKYLFFNFFFFFSRVGDCFDPILDPTPDRNPFWIAIRKSPTIGLEIVSIRFSIRPPIAIRFGSQSENLGSRSKISDRDQKSSDRDQKSSDRDQKSSDRDQKSSDRNRQSDRNLQPYFFQND